jgi:hypothetical protein
LGKGNKKNESIEFIKNRIKDLEYVSESSVWDFEKFDNIEREIFFLNESIELLFNDKISSSEFISNYIDLYEADNKNKTGGVKKDNTSTNSGKEINLGDKINPYQITTVPSLSYYGKKPMNPHGVGIKLPGDTAYLFKESTLGSSKYKMMVEAEKISIGRYPIGVTKFETYKPSDISNENCGMQIHRSSTKGVGVCVGPWSAGCQVFSDYTEWQEFISKAENEPMNNSKFIYALIQLDDIPDNVMQSAISGIAYNSAPEESKDKEENKSIPDKPKDSKREERLKNIKIQDLADYIKSEYDKTDSDEEGTIKKYNNIIKSKEDWKALEKAYKISDPKGVVSVWSTLSSYLSDEEYSKLKFKNSKMF